MIDYKRLTERDWNKEKFYPTTDNERAIRKRLWDLENKIEQGTLIELPCKVGDTVWFELVKGIDESGNAIHYLEQGTVFAIQIEKEEIWLRVSFGVLYCCRKATDFILTKAEAEKKLKELQE